MAKVVYTDDNGNVTELEGTIFVVHYVPVNDEDADVLILPNTPEAAEALWAVIDAVLDEEEELDDTATAIKKAEKCLN